MIVRAVMLLAVAAAVAVVVRRRPPGRRARLALGVLVPVALALLAWDVSFQALTDHQNFYLGPVNDIRHGRYMLVDDYSQYGVGVIYFLAAILAPLPFGYGTFVLALGVLTAVMFATVYAVLRVATRSLAFAAARHVRRADGEHDRHARPRHAVPQHGLSPLRHSLAARVRAGPRVSAANGRRARRCWPPTRSSAPPPCGASRRPSTRSPRSS